MKWWITVLPIVLIALVLNFRKSNSTVNPNFQGNGIVLKTFQNYYESVKLACKEYPKIPESYILALIGLECSGRKIVPHRFESHIYAQLKKVKKGQKRYFENIVQKDLMGKNERELRELASSWGPFQIMGYKSIAMNIDLDGLDNQDRIINGISWISENYGIYLEQGKYQDAFHLHNTGKPYPKIGKPFTFRNNYVSDGLSLMDSFQNLILQIQ